MDRNAVFRPWMAALVASMLVAPGVRATENQTFSDARAAFGKKNVVEYTMGALEGETDEEAGLYAVLSAMLLGKDRSILETQASMTNLLEGETDFYWGGFRVWSTKPEWKDGRFEISAGLPTVSMRAPLFGVPVGPITLRLDAGVVAEAEVTASLRPLISLPIQFTSVEAALTPKAAASGFVEGYATWIAIRGGVGGEVELVRANASVAGNVSFGATPPSFSFDGFISFLAGKIYAFVDYFNIFRWRWRRLIEPKIAEWKGKCIDLSKSGDADLGGDPCAEPAP